LTSVESTSTGASGNKLGVRSRPQVCKVVPAVCGERQRKAYLVVVAGCRKRGLEDQRSAVRGARRVHVRGDAVGSIAVPIGGGIRVQETRVVLGVRSKGR